jgi:hypothetical protein
MVGREGEHNLQQKEAAFGAGVPGETSQGVEDEGQDEIVLSHDTMWQTIQQLAACGVTTEPETLNDLLTGYLEGQEWVLKRFGWEKRPVIVLRPFEQERRTATAGYQVGQNRIGINTYKLQEYVGFPPEEHIIIMYPAIPLSLRPRMTARQFFEGAGVEETLHYLQDNHVDGLAPVPSLEEREQRDRERDLITERAQPHELEALTYVGRFFQEKYGSNPYTRMEADLRAYVARGQR